MFKMWTSLFAMTLFAALTVNGLRVFEEIWRYKCQIAGFEYDVEKDYKLPFWEFENCSRTALNTTQYMEDTNAMIQKFKLAELDISTVKPTLQKYCPQVRTLLNCTKSWTSKCLTEDEKLRLSTHGSIYKSFFDFFCDNDASRMTEFINGNGIQCGMAKELELRLCFEQFDDNVMSAAVSAAAMGDIFILFANLPNYDVLCNLLETAANCTTQLFQQCELSEAPAKQIADLFSYIGTETECATMPKDKEFQLKLKARVQTVQTVTALIQNNTARFKLHEPSSNTNSGAVEQRSNAAPGYGFARLPGSRSGKLYGSIS